MASQDNSIVRNTLNKLTIRLNRAAKSPGEVDVDDVLLELELLVCSTLPDAKSDKSRRTLKVESVKLSPWKHRYQIKHGLN
jgi:hypothetical protein